MSGVCRSRAIYEFNESRPRAPESKTKGTALSESKTVSVMLEECSRELSGTFTRSSILGWFRRHYPQVRESTISAHIQAMTSNATNREQNHPFLASRTPLFDRVSHGLYRVHDPSTDSHVVPESSVRSAASVTPASNAGPQADIVLVTCVKSKGLAPAAAKDLYTSALFVKERAYAERGGAPWYILSAEHGLVAPDEWLAPYERYLPDTSPEYRRAWGTWIAARLQILEGPLRGKTIEIHASSAYLEAVRRPLADLGAVITDPLRGLAMGERLSWYDADASSSLAGRGEPAELDVAALIQRLGDDATAMAPEAFLATQGTGLDRPGLYSWWVDYIGAGDLAQGLGLPVSEGLIYAGLAGATRWPSGKKSTNTLWLRIAGMHLGGRHEFSTFRRSMGSILASAAGSDQVDEPSLTAWMHRHLRVIAAPYDDADTLGHVESKVLEELDPPLNLQGMTSSAVRLRLKQLRRAVSR